MGAAAASFVLQHAIAPSVKEAHVRSSYAARSTTSRGDGGAIFATEFGGPKTTCGLFSPPPPQHAIVPSSKEAHVWAAPAAR
jgi:hypothetical protein